MSEQAISKSYESLESKCLMQEQEIKELRLQLETAKGKCEAFDWMKAKTESFNPNQRVTITFRPHGSLKSLVEYETLGERHRTHLDWNTKAYGGGDTLEQAVLALKKKLEPEEKAKELK